MRRTGCSSGNKKNKVPLQLLYVCVLSWRQLTKVERVWEWWGCPPAELKEAITEMCMFVSLLGSVFIDGKR